MDQVKKTCGNCGHFLQYYAFMGGMYFRPLCCGKCKLKRVHLGYIECIESVCEKWVSNEEELERERKMIESNLQFISRQLYDIILNFSAEERQAVAQMLDNDFRKS